MKTLKELRVMKKIRVKRIYIGNDERREKELIGEIEFRSKDYIFRCGQHESYGYILKEHLRDYGFEIEALGGHIQYHLI